MIKAELIDELSRKTGLTRIKAEVVVNTIFESIAQSLKENRRVEIRHFGTFSVRPHGSYLGRNPSTGKVIEVKEKRAPFFKAGKPLADRIKNNVSQDK